MILITPLLGLTRTRPGSATFPFNTFVIPTMFARVARGEAAPEAAAGEAERQIDRIFDRWNRAR